MHRRGQTVLQTLRSRCCDHRMQPLELYIDKRVNLDIPRGMMHKCVMVDKELIAATSRSLTLSILAEGDSYGYSIIQRVDELTDGQFKWTDSMLYPVLHRLEDQGSASSYWKPSPAGRKRKYYSLTDAGRRELEERQRQWGIAASAFSTLWDG